MAGGEAEGRIAGKAAEGVIARTVGSLVRDAEGPAGKAAEKDLATDAGAAAAAHPPGTHGDVDLAGLVGQTFDREHPGPLNDKYLGTFEDGRYEIGVTGEKDVYFRAGDAQSGRGRPELGEFFSDEPPTSVSAVRRDMAVKPEWTDDSGQVIARSPLNTGYGVEMPPGTYYYKGVVGSQGGPYVGGGTQYVFPEPWNYDPPAVKVGEWPLDP